MACEYNKWFLVAVGGSALWLINVYGTPFPTGTADLDNYYLVWLLSSNPRLGCRRSTPL